VLFDTLTLFAGDRATKTLGWLYRVVGG